MGKLLFKGVEIEHLTHAAFRVEGSGTVLYIDPFKVSEQRRDGDVIVCTHDHYDHCSPEDVKKVIKTEGIVVAAENCVKKLKGFRNEVKPVKPGDEVIIKGCRIRAVPAYNVNKPYHPREYGGIGVVVELAGVRLYHTGDSDLVSEMRDLRGLIDVVLIPVSGVYVMSVEEAVEAVKIIQPALAIPMHYGAIVGSASDAEKFKKLLEGICEVAIL